VREGPPKSRHPFEHAFIDLRYLDANRKAFNLTPAFYWRAFTHHSGLRRSRNAWSVTILLNKTGQRPISWC